MEEISVLNLFLQAGIVVKVVMILLFMASILSWIVIVERYKFFRKVKNENNVFLKKFWSGKDLSILHKEIEDTKNELSEKHQHSFKQIRFCYFNKEHQMHSFIFCLCKHFTNVLPITSFH